MTHIMLTSAVFLLCVFAVTLFSAWLLHAVAARLIGSRHRDLEEIVSTGNIPRRWIKAADSSPDSLRTAARAAHLKKLNRLTRYMRHTRLVESEETRSMLLRELDDVCRRLKGKGSG